MNTESEYTASHLANFFLDEAEKEGIGVSPMKLLKLVYIGYGWMIAALGKAPFDEPIGLTQAEAAKILATTNISVGRQERGDTTRGPLTGALEYLIASWPRLSEEQRNEVRQKLDELRGDAK